MEKFRRRHKLVHRRLHGEAVSVSLVAVEEGQKMLQEATSRFQLSDIYIMDETASYYCMAPSTTVSKSRIAGVKKIKKRKTMAVTTNADALTSCHCCLSNRK